PASPRCRGRQGVFLPRPHPHPDPHRTRTTPAGQRTHWTWTRARSRLPPPLGRPVVHDPPAEDLGMAVLPTSLQSQAVVRDATPFTLSEDVRYSAREVLRPSLCSVREFVGHLSPQGLTTSEMLGQFAGGEVLVPGD